MFCLFPKFSVVLIFALKYNIKGRIRADLFLSLNPLIQHPSFKSLSCSILRWRRPSHAREVGGPGYNTQGGEAVKGDRSVHRAFPSLERKCRSRGSGTSLKLWSLMCCHVHPLTFPPLSSLTRWGHFVAGVDRPNETEAGGR